MSPLSTSDDSRVFLNAQLADLAEDGDDDFTV